MGKLRVALVGCGGMMTGHVNAYKDLSIRGAGCFEVKATCDTQESLAAEKAKLISAFQGTKPNTYTRLEDMLRNESLDAVDMALPHDVHHVVACTCMKEGLDVMIEKPLAITMKAARLILDEAEKHTRVLAVAENYRRSEENRAIWWALKRGLLGQPRAIVWASVGWGPKPWGWRESKFVSGGSWMFDGGVHLADLDRYQLEREAVDVYAVQETFDKVKEGVNVTVDDMTMGIVRYQGGVYAQWLWTRAAPGKEFNMRSIYGSKGSLSNDGMTIQKDEGQELYSMNILVSRMLGSLEKEQKDSWFPMDARDTVATELYDFHDSIVNKRKPEVDGPEAYRDMAIPLALYESAVLVRPVSVRDVEELKVQSYQEEINERLGVK